MNELLSIKEIDFSPENIPKIFEKQRKNLKQDILFLKDDILKDFREIETKLNTKYESQNSNTLIKLHKFENSIEVMKNKIYELSNLIVTDNDIQQKVLNLQEFKTKVSDKLIFIDIALKENESAIKEAIDKYDKILNESIFYQGIIGSNCKFLNFHQLIDYLLLNINQFVIFKEKNMIDLKGYKIKLESLLKSLKIQNDSMTSNNIKFINKKISESEKRIKELINIQEVKLNDIQIEKNKLNSIENKLEEMNNEIKKILNIKMGNYTKLEEEIDLLKEFNKGVTIKFENKENEINFIKDKCNTLNEYLNNINLMTRKKIIKKKDNKLDMNANDFLKNNKNEEKKNNNNQFNDINNYNTINNSNNIRLMRRGSLVKSIVKQYINGEISINELEKPIKRQSSTFINENDLKKIINSNNSRKSYIKNYDKNSLGNLSKIKRLTLGPDNFKNFNKLNKNLLNKCIDSEKTILDQNNSSISEEKSEDIDYLNSFREKNSENKITNNKDKNINLSKEEGIKNDEKNDLLINIGIFKDTEKGNLHKNIEDNNKDKNIENKIMILKSNNKKEENNNGVQTDILNNDFENKRNNMNYSLNKTDNNKKNISKEKYHSFSYEKINIENNNSFIKAGNEKMKKINNQKQMSAVDKLRKIGGGENIINYNNNSNNFNKTRIIFSDNKINKDIAFYYYNNIKKIKPKKKLNIIEVNFDDPKDLIKEENELKSIIKKIKENRINVFSERNNRPLEKNYKINKQSHKSESDANSNSLNSLSNNLSNFYFYNKNINEEFKNYNSFGYLSQVKNNQKISHLRKMNISKKKRKYSNLID